MCVGLACGQKMRCVKPLLWIVYATLGQECAGENEVKLMMKHAPVYD